MQSLKAKQQLFNLIVKYEIECVNEDCENRNSEFTHVYLIAVQENREKERRGEEKYILQLDFTNKKKMDTQIRQSKNNFDK